MRGKVAPGVGSGRRPQGKCQQRSRNGLPGVGMMLLPPPDRGTGAVHLASFAPVSSQGLTS